MPTVAEQLHSAREGRSLTVHQVAEVTKIRTDHIRALEEGNFDAFSAPVYIRGFVRSYATLLKLDVAQVMATLDAELGRTEKFREPPPLTPASKGVLDFLTLQLSKINWRVAVFVVIALAVIGGALAGLRLWKRHSADPFRDLPPAVEHAPQGGQTLPLPPVSPRRQ